jgi:RNA polymerase sigma-70 factor (ECF subfamily)
MAAMVMNPVPLRLNEAPARTYGGSMRDGSKAGTSAALLPALGSVSRHTVTATDKSDAAAAPRQEPGEDFRPEGHHGGAPAPISEAILAEQARLSELAAKCLRGDAYAWETLVRSQQRRVYGLCYRFTGSPSAAEDLTQDVFLKLYRNLASFDSAKASFGVWLTALTRNLLVDHYRRSRMERVSESLDESASGDEDGPTRAERLPDGRGGQERHVAGVELRAKIQAALSQVSPELREAVILRDLEDMDYREIADTLCIPQGTVKSRISRGRAELARLLKGMEGQVV